MSYYTVWLHPHHRLWNHCTNLMLVNHLQIVSFVSGMASSPLDPTPPGRSSPKILQSAVIVFLFIFSFRWWRWEKQIAVILPGNNYDTLRGPLYWRSFRRRRQLMFVAFQFVRKVPMPFISNADFFWTENVAVFHDYKRLIKCVCWILFSDLVQELEWASKFILAVCTIPASVRWVVSKMSQRAYHVVRTRSHGLIAIGACPVSEISFDCVYYRISLRFKTKDKILNLNWIYTELNFQLQYVWYWFKLFI